MVSGSSYDDVSDYYLEDIFVREGGSAKFLQEFHLAPNLLVSVVVLVGVLEVLAPKVLLKGGVLG